mgnify:CR=1 FL=1
MKRWIAVLLALLMVLALCSCGSTPANDQPDASQTQSNDAANNGENAGGVQVDKGLLSVEITLPATFFEDQTEEEIKAAAQEEGIEDCRVNADGSVTYQMSKAKHKELMEEMKNSIQESVDALVSGEDAVESFREIQHSEDFSQFDVIVDPATYTEWDSVYMLNFCMLGAYYQMFDGMNIDQVDVVVQFIDGDTNEVLDSGSFRDLMDHAETTED